MRRPRRGRTENNLCLREQDRGPRREVDTSRQKHLTAPWLRSMLLHAPPYMARARRLPPLVLQTAQRTTICDLDVHVQEVPPDALDRHRAPRALLPRVRMLVPLVARARLAVGDGERASRLARSGDEAAAVRREA